MSFAGSLLQDRYRVVSELGSGGMATVYLAHDERLDRRVAVKVPHRHLLSAPDARARFLREVESLSRLAHPHIVAIQDSGEHEGVPYAVVQWVGGGDLETRLAQSPGGMAPEAVALWLGPIADALDAVHAHGFLHRDVKPANLLFDERGNPLLADFGIAALLTPETPPGSAEPNDGRLTQTGGFIGSARYAPPESVKRELSPAYDQYSLGLVAYKALSGRLPFHAETPEDLLIAKHSQAPVPLGRVARGVPLAATQAVMRALEREPARRFASCSAFARAFEEGLRPGAGADAAPPLHLAHLALAIAFGITVMTGLFVWIERQIRPEVSGERQGSTRSEPAATATSGPSSFLAGSTEAERADALALCRAYADDCDPDWYADEAPRHVPIPAARLDPHEVTNAEFARFTTETGHRTEAERAGFSYAGPVPIRGLDWRAPRGPGSDHRTLPRHPVVHVGAGDAEAYCAFRGQRLPTEDEWEFAARGLGRRLFPWGDEWAPERASWRRSDATRLEAVQSHPSGDTPEGLSDLAGNALEWTLSTPGGGERVLKGGSWRESNPAHLRAAARYVETPAYTGSDVGFRCATPPPDGTSPEPGGTHPTQETEREAG